MRIQKMKMKFRTFIASKRVVEALEMKKGKTLVIDGL